MTHDAGEKSLVTAGDIIATAKQALSKEFPERKFEEMDREELVAMLQVQGMQALDEQVETLETKVEKITQELSEIKQLLQRLLKKG